MATAIAELRVDSPALAGRLVNALERASGILADAVPISDNSVSDEQRKQIARALGTVLAMDMHDMLMVLLTQHPQLDTHGLLDPTNGEIQ